MSDPSTPEAMERLRVIRQLNAEKRKRTADGTFVKKEEPDYQTPRPKADQPLAEISNPFLSVSNTGSVPEGKGDPPLVNVGVKVTNPVTYLKNWFRRIIGNEAITIRVKTVTALMIAVILASGGITLTLLNYLKSTVPVVKYIPSVATSPGKQTAFSGTFVKTDNAYFLVANTDTVITLSLPSNIDAQDINGKRVLVTGEYHEDTKVLYVVAIHEVPSQ